MQDLPTMLSIIVIVVFSTTLLAWIRLIMPTQRLGPKTRGDHAPLEARPQDENQVLSWTLNAEMIRKHRHQYVKDYPAMRIVVDKAKRTVTFENCYRPLGSHQSELMSSQTCSFEEIRDIYVSESRHMAGVTIVTPHGNGFAPSCEGLPNEGDLNSVIAYLALCTSRNESLGLRRSPIFPWLVFMVVMTLGIIGGVVVIFVFF